MRNLTILKKVLAQATILASVLMPLSFATPAFALGVTVGNPAISRANVDSYSNFTIIDTNSPVSATGWLTTFSYYAVNTNSFEFVLVDSANVVKWISPTITPAGTGLQTYNINVPVTAGWNLGVHFDQTGTIPFDYIGAPATYTPNNNGMPTVGVALTVQGTSNRMYSWNGNGSDASICTVMTLSSGTTTQFKGLTTTDPLGSSVDGLYTGGTANAVVTGPDIYVGAWDTAGNNPLLAGASWVNNNSTAPSVGGVGAGQEATENVWRLFGQSFTLPVGSTINSATLSFSADNSASAFLDNALIASVASYNVVTTATLGASVGTHELEFVVKNDAYAGQNPTAVIYRADISYCVPATPPVTECPAAPSIAADLLKLHNVKPKTTSPNYISEVAKHMGPQTTFNGVNACNTAAYRTAVDAYLHTLGAY